MKKMILIRIMICVLCLAPAYSSDCKDEAVWCANLTQFCDNNEEMVSQCKKTCKKCFVTEPSIVFPKPKEGDDGDVVIINRASECITLKCEHSCKPEIGCVCKKGYELQDDKLTCKDIDECIRDLPCDTNKRCINTEGSYTCTDGCGPEEITYYNSTKCCRLSKEQCGKSSLNDAMLTRGSEETIVNRWPWASLINIKPHDTNCVGILVSRVWVVTTAHCLGKAKSKNTYAYFGIPNTGKDGFRVYSQMRRVNKIRIHPEYNFPYYNLAVVRLSRAIQVTSHVGIVCMPQSEHPPVGQKCWGINYEKQGLDSKYRWLQQEEYTITNKNKCAANNIKLDQTLTCVKRESGKKSCEDFSGGPMVCQRCSSCDWYVAGLESSCATENGISSFTSLSAEENWIRKILGFSSSNTNNPSALCQSSDVGSRNIINWSSWSNWSDCSASCGNGFITRKRTCRGGDPGEVGCRGKTEEEKPCSVDECSGWGEYSNWSECSRSCRGGTRYRSRECLNGKAGSMFCKGIKRQKEKCNVLPCPKWGRWGKWQKCNVTCGTGTQTSQRKCQNGKIGDKGCIGREIKNKQCKRSTCSSWSNWGSWSDCSSSCGAGEQRATRQCMIEKKASNSCQGNSIITRPCALKECKAQWSAWSLWSNCSKACGGGESIRTRQCERMAHQKPCLGQNKMSKKCNTVICKSTWSNWGSWSKCDSQCGRGRTRRERECESIKCSGRPFQEKDCFVECKSREPCSEHRDNLPFCKINIALCGSHILWGRCDKTCCLEEYKYAYSEWSSWSSCSRLCGGGLQTRQRYCVAPLSCRKFDARLTEDRKCNEQRCSARNLQMCSASCGGGIRQKTILCDGENCEDDQSFTFEPCNTQPCPSTLSPWSQWSQCSETCGDGTRKRERNCLKEYSSCSGVQVDIEKCKVQTCNGTWSEWRQWGFCSVNCGIGTIRRSRVCIEGVCSGPDYQEEACVTFDCPIETSTCEDQVSMQYLCPMLTNYCDNAFMTYACRKTCKLC